MTTDFSAASTVLLACGHKLDGTNHVGASHGMSLTAELEWVAHTAPTELLELLFHSGGKSRSTMVPAAVLANPRCPKSLLKKWYPATLSNPNAFEWVWKAALPEETEGLDLPEPPKNLKQFKFEKYVLDAIRTLAVFSPYVPAELLGRFARGAHCDRSHKTSVKLEVSVMAASRYDCPAKDLAHILGCYDDCHTVTVLDAAAANPNVPTKVLEGLSDERIWMGAANPNFTAGLATLTVTSKNTDKLLAVLHSPLLHKNPNQIVISMIVHTATKEAKVYKELVDNYAKEKAESSNSITDGYWNEVSEQDAKSHYNEWKEIIAQAVPFIASEGIHAETAATNIFNLGGEWLQVIAEANNVPSKVRSAAKLMLHAEQNQSGNIFAG